MTIKSKISASLFACLLLLGCQQQADIEKKTSLETEEVPQDRLYIETTSQSLEPSQIQLGALIKSEIDSNPNDADGGTQAGVSSQAESQQVAVSQVEVQEIIADLDAQQTSEGLEINLPESILFDFDRYELRADSQPTLKKVSQLINYYKNVPVEIAGHTDSKGSDAYNQQLSEQRAEAVQEILVEKFDIDRNRLSAKGFGESKPIASNTKSDGSDNPAGRQENRRVEVIVKNK